MLDALARYPSSIYAPGAAASLWFDGQGLPPNVKELISASEDVTYWATDKKARERLGYTPRDLETGLRQTLEGRSTTADPSGGLVTPE